MLSYLRDRALLFKERNFTLYFLSCVLVSFANGSLFINMAWLVINVEKDVMSVALIFFFFWLPVVIFSPVMGVISDRYSRKGVLVFANFYRGIVFLIFLAVFMLDYHIYQVYVMMFIEGIGLALALPLVFTMNREVAPEGKLMLVNATVDMGYETGSILGMGLAGFIILLVGAKFAIVFNAACFIVAGFIAMMLRLEKKVSQGIKTVKQVLTDYTESLSYVFARKELMKNYMAQLLIMAQFMTLAVLLAPFAKHILHTSVVEFSLIEVCLSIGVIFGGLIVPWLAQEFGAKKTVVGALLVIVVSYFFFIQTTTVMWAMIIYLILGVAYGAWPVVMTRAQEMTDLKLQGRVQATFNTLASAAVLLVYWLTGLVGMYLPENYLFGIEIIFAISALVFILFTRSRSNG